MELRFKLVRRGRHHISLMVFHPDQEGRANNLLSFKSDGTIVRSRGINSRFGLDLDNRGRLIIHGQ